MDLFIAIAFDILFVLIAVDDVGFGGFDLAGILGVGVGEGEQQLPGIGAPGIVVDAAFDLCQSFAFAAAAVHQPNLAAFGLLP